MAEDQGSRSPNLLEAETDRAFIAAAQRVVVVADNTKWGVRGLSRVARLDEADVVVTDSGLPTEAKETLEGHVERVVLAPVARAGGARARRGASAVSSRRTSTRGTRYRPHARRTPPGRPHGRACSSSAPARSGPICPRRPARSARAVSRRPSRTTCGGFRTGGRRCPGGRCEVVLYTPEHEATFWSLGVRGARKVSTCGPSAAPRSGRATTSRTSSSSRTAVRRSARPSPTPTARSTPSTGSRTSRCSSWSAASASRPQAIASSRPPQDGGPGFPRHRSSRMR